MKIYKIDYYHPYNDCYFITSGHILTTYFNYNPTFTEAKKFLLSTMGIEIKSKEQYTVRCIKVIVK